VKNEQKGQFRREGLIVGSNCQPGAALGTDGALAGALVASEETIFDSVYTLIGDMAALVGQSRRILFHRHGPQSQPAETSDRCLQSPADRKKPHSPQAFQSIE
jgi:hypothetical protein